MEIFGKTVSPENFGLGLFLGSSIFLAYISYIVYNLFFHPLANFPGSLLAGATRWYDFYFDVLVRPGGQYMYEIERMHRLYGPIIRIGPNELHINDPAYRDELYALGTKRDKVPYMVDIFATTLAIFGTEKHDLHRSRRAALNPYFSKKSVMQLESVIQQKALKMGESISANFKQGKNIKIRHALTACIIDITTEYSFAKCANALQDPDFAPEWDAMMAGVSEFVPLARSFPGIVQVMQSLPVSVVRFINPLMGSFADFEQLVRSHVREAFANYEVGKLERISGSATSQRYSSIFNEILESSMPEHEKTIDRMTQEALSVISAASETTSSVLASIIFFVSSNKSYTQRLNDELTAVMPEPTSIAEWRKLEELPFLSAIIKEGLRFSVAICSRLPLVSSKPLKFKEWIIPEGTYVGMSPGDALHHPEIFKSPKEFLPDRWLDADSHQLQLMNMAFVPFNRGPRMCIGLNLAYANMYHIISTLFRRFEFELVDTIRERDLDMVRDHFVSKPTRSSRGVTIKILRERSF